MMEDINYPEILEKLTKPICDTCGKPATDMVVFDADRNRIIMEINPKNYITSLESGHIIKMQCDHCILFEKLDIMAEEYAKNNRLIPISSK